MRDSEQSRNNLEAIHSDRNGDHELGRVPDLTVEEFRHLMETEGLIAPPCDESVWQSIAEQPLRNISAFAEQHGMTCRVSLGAEPNPFPHAVVVSGLQQDVLREHMWPRDEVIDAIDGEERAFYDALLQRYNAINDRSEHVTRILYACITEMHQNVRALLNPLTRGRIARIEHDIDRLWKEVRLPLGREFYEWEARIMRSYLGLGCWKPKGYSAEGEFRGPESTLAAIEKKYTSLMEEQRRMGAFPYDHNPHQPEEMDMVGNA